jgi:putative CocE/NonD family hydrolase
MKSSRTSLLAAVVIAIVWFVPASAQEPAKGDIPAAFKAPTEASDYVKRDVMIPMRDGVKLHTVLVLPKDAKGAPMILDRTPYSADKFTSVAESTLRAAILPRSYGELSDAGYIIVSQDVRGKYKSEGDYVMNRPLSGDLNQTPVDHSTDAWDTIDWLVKNVPESNGKVGTMGTSYDGFTVLMSLVNPHPALKAAAAFNPMVDTWMGDDWFHNGALRQTYADYIYEQTASTSSDEKWTPPRFDAYETWLGGSADSVAQSFGMEQLPFWKRLRAHPAYDRYWSGQAVDKILASRPLTVPTLYIHSQWDQEDIYGAPAVFAATRSQSGPGRDNSFLVIGPWRHGGGNGDGSALGAIKFDGDTGRWVRQHVLVPFLDAHLKDGAPKADIATVTAYETGANVWRRYDTWPQSCAAGCPNASKPLYLSAGSHLSFDRPAAAAGFDEYVSDPGKPVTYRARPIRPTYAKDSTWGRWLVDDQRFAADRPDVLTYTSAKLTAPVRIAGQPIAHLFASTSGTDTDWVVKLIDVYPDEVAEDKDLGGYQLPVAMDIMRGRYRDNPAKPSAIPAGRILQYQLKLPNADHVFLPGHRIMVQVQSTWFPLYDRNPQSFVPNIFDATPADYKKATLRVFHRADAASYVELPLLP